MGELIVLPRAERPSHPVPSSNRSAEILFFTGVRYYRMTDAPPAPVIKTRRRRTASARIAAEA